MKEAILQLRAGDDLTDLVTVSAFVIFVNFYNSLFGVKTFLSQFHIYNQKITKIKKEILSIFNDLQKKDLIYSRF